MSLGNKLLNLRKEKGLSQEEVAEKLNVTRQTVSKWETNQSTPDFDKILPLCDLFEISPNELLKEKEQEEIIDDDNAQYNFDEIKKHLFTRGKEDDYENMTKNQIKQKSAEVVSSSILLFIVAYSLKTCTV